MCRRNLALGGALAVIVGLAALTIVVMVNDGVDVLVVVSLLTLAMLGLGVFGALSHPPDE
ncbi:MAG: hypothetical protein NVS2B6_13340 [Thermoleophilaceae bacterium]